MPRCQQCGKNIFFLSTLSRNGLCKECEEILAANIKVESLKVANEELLEEQRRIECNKEAFELCTYLLNAATKFPKCRNIDDGETVYDDDINKLDEYINQIEEYFIYYQKFIDNPYHKEVCVEVFRDEDEKRASPRELLEFEMQFRSEDRKLHKAVNDFLNQLEKDAKKILQVCIEAKGKNEIAKDVIMKKSPDSLDRIKKLHELYQMGAITEEEYNEKKSELLTSI